MPRWLALSIAVHVVVVAVLAWRSRPGVIVAVTTEPQHVVPVPVPVSDVIEVQFFDAPQIAANPNAISVVVATRRNAPREVVAEPSPPTDVESNRNTEPSKPDVAANRIAQPTPQLAATPFEPTVSIHASIPSPTIAASNIANLAAQAGLGMREPSAEIDTGASPFTIRVSPDGTAHITDRSNAHFATGSDVAHEIRVHGDEQWLEQHHERSNALEMKVPSVGATIAVFDVTDAAMRLAGQDPYAFQKLKILDGTREQRVQIGTRYRERQTIQTPALVRSNLDDIVKLPAAQRQQALAELLRDLDHSKSGDVARATIATYMHDHELFSAAERDLVAP